MFFDICTFSLFVNLSKSPTNVTQAYLTNLLYEVFKKELLAYNDVSSKLFHTINDFIEISHNHQRELVLQ